MIRCRIAWFSQFEERDMEPTQENLANAPEDFGDTFTGETEGEIYAQLFKADWTSVDSITVWDYGVEGRKFRVIGTWIVEAGTADSATAAIEDAVNRCGLNVELDSCEAEEE